MSLYSLTFLSFRLIFLGRQIGKWSLIELWGTQHSEIFLESVQLIWSIIELELFVTRVGLDTICLRSNN